MSGYVQVLTTTPSQETAQAIAEVLVGQHLAACVQIAGPIESRYWWEGKIEVAHEWQCLAKSRLDLFPRIEEAIRGRHPYQVPEIIVTRIEGGNAAYLDWLRQELGEA